MTSKFSRLTLVAFAAIGGSGLVAAPAMAATPPPSVSAPAVTPAVDITPESATIAGVVDTGNAAPGTSYTFEYDTLKDYEAGADLAQFAGPFFAPASTSLSYVSAPVGCYPSSTCSSTGGTPLQPDTTYVYFIQTQPGVSGAYYDTQSLSSSLGEFKTGSLGKISLSSAMLKVSRKSSSFGIKCTSSETCKGSFKVTVTVKGKTKTLKSGKFSVGSSRTTTEKLKLSGAEASALANNKKLSGRITLTSTTDQKNVSKSVTLKS